VSGRLDIEGAVNFRDVGGYPARGGRTRHGQLFRSGVLSGITPTGVADLSGLRIGVVVDLRSDTELAQDHAPYVIPGATLVRVPIATGSPASIVEGDHVSLELLYRHLLTCAGWSLTAAVSAIAQSDGTPVLVHCTAGKDRTGLVIAMALEAAGVERAAVVADYMQSALNLDGAWLGQTLSKLVSNGVPVSPALIEAIGGSPAAAMSRVLAWLEAQYGSVEGYLADHGLVEDGAAALADKLVG
jgi:protein-tyrosine phosphatase